MVKIKICGLCREDDVSFANEAMPDFAGFVFAPSRRQVSPSQAVRFRDRLEEPIIPVGVFVNAPIAEIKALFADGVIALAQLHGREDSAYLSALKACCAAPVIRAIRVERHEDLVPWQRKDPLVDYLLLDSGPGGTGRSFQWDLLGTGRPASPYFLAGGITLDNLGEALAYRPYGIDVSSGAETQGFKDRTKMVRLVQRVREDQS
ncbi:MAG: phosphoribosylanthranilate isomerase [Treponema sp.]|jgi:phosphoribosylanthranilate isomerase|nr:phosphoribosylanthranilate isomerase [Treponema sp.]